MRRLVYLDSARDDFQDIFKYITRHSGSQAIGRSFVQQVRAQCAKLAALPHTLGTARPELRPDLRSFVFKGYTILFRYVGDSFEVVDVIEGHRDIHRLF